MAADVTSMQATCTQSTELAMTAKACWSLSYNASTFVKVKKILLYQVPNKAM